MKNELIYRIFDVMVDLVLSDGGDGCGCIVTLHPDIHSMTFLGNAFDEYKKSHNFLKNWEKRINLARISYNNNQESISITDINNFENLFNEYVIMI